MRVAHIVRHFPSRYETFILRQMLGLSRSGIEVDVYSLFRGEENARWISPEADSLVKRTCYLDAAIPHNGNQTRNALALAVRHVLTHPMMSARAFAPLWKFREPIGSAPYYFSEVMRRRHLRYDIVHCQFGQLGSILGYASDLWGAKLVVHMRGRDFQTYPARYGPRIYDHLFSKACAVFTTSNFGRESVIKLGCREDKVVRIYSPTPVSEFPFRERRGPPASGRVTLISVGRLVKIKGQEYVIRAMPEILKHHSAAVYEMVGDGPEQSRLESLANELGIRDSVIFKGAANSREVAASLDRADVFLMPSTQEALGNAAVEAQASGLPVIASNVGGLPEVVRDGVTGHLVPPADPEAIAAKVLDLLNRPDDWASMGRAGRAHAMTTFDIDTHVRQVLSAYETVLRKADSSAH